MKKDPTIKDVYEIIQFMSENAANKDDLANMATKDDIKNMATKDDIASIHRELDEIHNTMATRRDLNELRLEITEHVDFLVKNDTALALRQDKTEKKLDLIIRKNNLKLN
ncbi:MAG: hypothetical protein GF349_00785 [Candidatus Magasanikbacteria bacterium]|nr:hypothetical protein [Candidatus Magasanikbacteria bacterium]